MIFISWIILSWTTLKLMKGLEGTLTIGVISKDASCVQSDDIINIGHNITIDNYNIDTTEVYQLYKTVHTLDRNETIDAIMLLDPNVIDEASRPIITPQNKKLVEWRKGDGSSELFKNRIVEDNYVTGSNPCGTYHSPVPYTGGPYCVRYTNATNNNRDEKMATLVPKMLTSIVVSLSWKHVFIFYETATEYETSKLVDLLSQKRVLVVMFNIEHVENFNSLLQTIYEKNVEKEQYSSKMNIVVFCQQNYTQMIMRKANVFDKSRKGRKTLIKKFSKWLIVGYGYCKCDDDLLHEDASDLDNVAVLAVPKEFRSPNLKDVVTALNDIIYEVHKLYPKEDDSNFKSVVIDRILEVTRSKCMGYNIDTLLWTANGRAFNQIGHVERNGRVVLETDIFPNVNYGYNKREFLVSILSYSPFVMKKIVNGTATYEGFTVDLFQELSRILNFTYTLIEPPDGLWGAFASKDNLTFNGLVGQAQRQEVDIIGAPLADHPERRQVMDFSIPFYYEYVSVIFKKPNPDAIKWRKLLDPLKWEVLVSIGVALIVMSILTHALEKNNPFYLRIVPVMRNTRNGGLRTWAGAFWYLFGALLCQGGRHLPASATGRTVVSFWWLFCIIVVGTYSGNLIAFLTVTKEVPPFNTLAEMLMLRGMYKWGTTGNTAWEMILRTSTNPTFRAVGESMVEFNRSDPGVLSVNLSEQLQKVREGGFVWIGDKTSIELEMMTECDLMTTKEEFMPTRYAFGFPNYSPHEALFSEQLMKIQESGLLQIWKQKWWPKANFCNRNVVTEAKPISLEDVQSAFYVCCIGIFVGMVTLMIEIIIHKCRKNKPPNDDEMTNDKSAESEHGEQ